jgi:quercetin dioxygenase-like cupin family protein
MLTRFLDFARRRIADVVGSTVKSSRQEQDMIRPLRLIQPGALVTASLFAVAVALSATAQDTKPQTTKGISLRARDTLPLGQQIPELNGYAMQLRTVVLEPGAVAGYHSHANRPVVAYLVSGEYTEHRDGAPEIVHKAGEQWVEGADVAHWSENRGEETAVLINVEIFKTR